MNPNGIISKLLKSFGLSILKSEKYNELIISGNRNQFSLNTKTEVGAKEYADAYTDEVYVYGCTYLIANSIAGLPLKIYRDKIVNNEIVPEEVKTHPAYTLFKKPNNNNDFNYLQESLSANLELIGNGYIFKDDFVGKYPRKIYTLNSSKVKIIPGKTPSEYISGYKYETAMGNGIDILPEELSHIKYYNSTDDFYGLSSISAAKWSVATIQEARKTNRNIFRNGCKLGSVLETDQELDDAVYLRLKEDFSNKYQGSDKAHKTAILEKGLKYKDIGIALKDLEFIAGMKLSREEICIGFGVPPILLGILENASYNNIYEAQKIFWNFTLIPKIRKMESFWTNFIQLWNVPNCYCKFDLTNVEALKENWSGKIKDLQVLWSMGTPLSIGKKLLQIPIATFDGDDISYLPFSVSPAESPKLSSVTPALPSESTPSTPPKIINHKHIKIVWTEEKKIDKWNKFINVVTNIEKSYKIELDKFFSEQREEVLTNLEQYKSINIVEVEPNIFLFYVEYESKELDKDNKEITVLNKRHINIENIIFDFDKEKMRLVKISKPKQREALIKNAQAELDLMRINISFDVTNPKVVAWLEQNALNKAEYVIDSKRQALKDSLIEGVNAGESIPKLQDRVKEFYKLVEDYQTERVARTEVIGAANQGALESYQQAGVKSKGWLAAVDERTRPTHLKAYDDYKDGIPIDDNFQIGSDSMSAPGQGTDPAENINCRCSLIGITGD